MILRELTKVSDRRERRQPTQRQLKDGMNENIGGWPVMGGRHDDVAKSLPYAQGALSQAIIDVMAPAWCRPLLSRMPEVNEAIPMPLGHGALEIGERRKLGHSLRERRYDRAFVLPNSFKSASCRSLREYRIAQAGSAKCATAC